ncbi:MAG: hypothetical protein MI739_13410 [Bacteroidales bacterium]|nr:hypothetical protein [Bacteroidales bacterium]
MVKQNKLASRKIHIPVFSPVDDFEYWNFIIKTENGEFIKVSFSINETFNVPIQSSVKFYYIDKDLNQHVETLCVESNKNQFSEIECDININDNYCIEYDDYYELNVLINRSGLCLKIEALEQSDLSDNKGIVSQNLVGTKFLGWAYPFVKSKCQGTLICNGVKTEIKGEGTMLHCWGNDYIGKELECLITGEIYLDNQSCLYFIMIRDTHVEANLIVKQEGKILRYIKDYESNDFDIKIKNQRKYRDMYYPVDINISRPGEINFDLNILKEFSQNKNTPSSLKSTLHFNAIGEYSIDYQNLNYQGTSILDLYLF